MRVGAFDIFSWWKTGGRFLPGHAFWLVSVVPGSKRTNALLILAVDLAARINTSGEGLVAKPEPFDGRRTLTINAPT